MSATLIVAMASSCAGAPSSSQAIPSVDRNAHAAAPTSASPQATTSATVTPSAQPSSPGQYVKGIAAPAFPTALTSGPVTRDANGSVSQTDAANTHVNVFDPSGAFAGQLDSAQTGANGQPIARLTDASNHQVQMNLPDISGLPENTATTVGDLQITKDTANELIAMTGLGLTAHGSYDASSGTVIVQLSNNSQYRVPVQALLRQIQALHPRDSTDCALRIAALIAAIAAVIILIVAASANCAALASTPFGWVLLGGCLYTLGLLVASVAALIIALNALRQECWPSPSPSPSHSPTPTPVPTRTATAVPTATSTAAAAANSKARSNLSLSTTRMPTRAPVSTTAARYRLGFIVPLSFAGAAL